MVRASDQCSKGCELEQQNMPFISTQTSTRPSVFCLKRTLLFALIKRDSFKIKKNLIYVSVDQAFCEILYLY